MSQDYTRSARDPDAGRRRWLIAMPIIAIVLAIPLLFLSVRFSLVAVQFLQMLNQISAPNGAWKPALIILTGSGWIALAAAVVCALIVFWRHTVRWRLWWSVAIVLIAAANPIAWAVLGFF